MNQLLCIVGPTATGKTARAVKEASQVPSLVVSADSRQVYRGMDIVTGKDHPLGSELVGIDLVDPDQDSSVALWYDAVMPLIKQAWSAGKQVIVVGGTGLYVRALTEGIPTMTVPPNPHLRTQLTALSLSELQNKLADLDPARFASLNPSDRHNPRRLMRAIEVVESGISPNPHFSPPNSLLIGLSCSDVSQHRNTIRNRVLARLAQGAVQETERLLARYDQQLPSMTAIGYRSLIKFVRGELSETAMVNSWVEDELAYAKRQLTWFQKDKSIQWYDISK